MAEAGAGQRPPHDRDVFVSYSTDDKPIADAIVHGLEETGIRCWVAPRDVMPGMIFGDEIVRAIESSRVMVVVVSDTSNRSHHVVREVGAAVANNVIVVPFRVDATELTGAMSYYLSTEHWLDAVTPPIESHVAQLATVVRDILATAPVAARRQGATDAAPASAPEPSDAAAASAPGPSDAAAASAPEPSDAAAASAAGPLRPPPPPPQPVGAQPPPPPLPPVPQSAPMPAVPAPIVAAAPTARRLRPGLPCALIAGGVLLLLLVAGAVTAGVLLTRPTTPSDAGGTQPTDSLIPEGPVAVGMGVTITPAENWSAFAQGDDYVLLYSDDLVDYAGLDVTVSAAPPATIEEALAADIQLWGRTGATVAPAGSPSAWQGDTFDQVLSVTFECPADSTTCEGPKVGTYTELFDTETGNRAFVIYDAPSSTVLEAHQEEADSMIESLG
ncbi:toll/interleukin-1 receptor domain-containing protein [Agromyces tardus]|nr:toll/interleukin-1 receptor domain-containing protein [Agromyces tardus]